MMVLKSIVAHYAFYIWEGVTEWTMHNMSEIEARWKLASLSACACSFKQCHSKQPRMAGLNLSSMPWPMCTWGFAWCYRIILVELNHCSFTYPFESHYLTTTEKKINHWRKFFILFLSFSSSSLFLFFLLLHHLLLSSFTLFFLLVLVSSPPRSSFSFTHHHYYYLFVLQVFL